MSAPDHPFDWNILHAKWTLGGFAPQQLVEFAVSALDMGEFVHFVVQDLYEQENIDEVRRVFRCVKSLLDGADEETKNLITLGFFETLQNCASWRPGGNKVYEQFFGEASWRIWRELQRIWAPKSSLMQVIRSESEENTLG